MGMAQGHAVWGLLKGMLYGDGFGVMLNRLEFGNMLYVLGSGDILYDVQFKDMMYWILYRA